MTEPEKRFRCKVCFRITSKPLPMLGCHRMYCPDHPKADLLFLAADDPRINQEQLEFKYGADNRRPGAPL